MRYIVVLSCLTFLLAANTAGQGQRQKQLILDFEGIKVFTKQQLLDVADKCLAQQRESRDRNDARDIDYCLRQVKSFLFSKGYLQAKIGELRRHETATAILIVIPIEEGVQYRLGKVEIKGSALFTRQQLLDMLILKSGDIASTRAILDWLDGRVKSSYANHGYIRFSYTANPSFRPGSDSRNENVVDLIIEIDEGQRFTIRSINFDSNGSELEGDLQKELLVRIGEVFNKELFDRSLKGIDQTGRFETIDVDKDVDYSWNDSSPLLDLTIHLKKKH